MKAASTALVCLALSGGVLLGTTVRLQSLRGAIAEDAIKLAALETRLVNAQDAQRSAEAHVVDALQPEVLKARLHGRLNQPAEGQILRLNATDILSGVSAEEGRSGL
jgi:hypothetical protein